MPLGRTCILLLLRGFSFFFNFKRFFLVWTIITEWATALLLFHVLVFGREARRVSASQRGWPLHPLRWEVTF